MNLFDKLKNKRSSLQEKKDDEIKKPTKKANKEVFDVTGKSAAKDAKKYSSGEYPKIGGGERMSPKSKGPGASTGGTNTPPATVGGKSKGTTPVKVNITKPVKQSEVSKKAKEFTQNLKKIKGTKTGKSISTGDIGFTAPDRKTKVAKRTTRAIKQGTPDPFDIDTSKAAKQTAKDFGTPIKSQIKKLVKKPGGYRAPEGAFGPGITQGQANVKDMQRSAFRKTQPRDVKLPKSFTDFSKKLKTYKTDVAKTTSATPRTVTKKYKPTTTVKQADISKKIARQNKEYNVDRKIKADDAKRFKDFEADAKFAKDKFRKQRDAVAKKKTLTGAEKSKAARELNRKARSASELQKSYKLASQGYGTPGVTPIAKAADLKAVTGSAKVTVNKTLGKRTTKAPSKFRKIVDKIRTNKIGSKVVKGLSKSRYGKIAGAALGVAGAVAGISALSKPKTDKTALNLSSKKDVVRGPVIKDLSTGKPKRFQLGKPVTDDDLKGTTFAKKIKIKTNTKNT